MPTFEDPRADAEELGQAARGLAYVTRHIESPQTILTRCSVRCIKRCRGCSSRCGSCRRGTPGTPSSPPQTTGTGRPGRSTRVKASGWLTIAAASTEEVLQVVMKAQSENGRIAWQPDRHINTSPSTLTALPEALSQRRGRPESRPTRIIEHHHGPEFGLSRAPNHPNHCAKSLGQSRVRTYRVTIFRLAGRPAPMSSTYSRRSARSG